MTDQRKNPSSRITSVIEARTAKYLEAMGVMPMRDPKCVCAWRMEALLESD